MTNWIRGAMRRRVQSCEVVFNTQWLQYIAKQPASIKANRARKLDRDPARVETFY